MEKEKEKRRRAAAAAAAAVPQRKKGGSWATWTRASDVVEKEGRSQHFALAMKLCTPLGKGRIDERRGVFDGFSSRIKLFFSFRPCALQRRQNILGILW
jgi:hypothetical protein